MDIEKTIEGLTDEIDFMIGMGTAPLVGESARRILRSQQEEIKALKIDLRKSKEFNCNLAQENNEFKAQVELLRNAAKQTDGQFRIHAKLTDETKTILSCALNKTKKQCLSDIRASAIDKFSILENISF